MQEDQEEVAPHLTQAGTRGANRPGWARVFLRSLVTAGEFRMRG